MCFFFFLLPAVCIPSQELSSVKPPSCLCLQITEPHTTSQLTVLFFSSCTERWNDLSRVTAIQRVNNEDLEWSPMCPDPRLPVELSSTQAGLKLAQSYCDFVFKTAAIRQAMPASHKSEPCPQGSLSELSGVLKQHLGLSLQWPKDKPPYNRDERNLLLLTVVFHAFLRMGLITETTICQL